MAFGVTSAAPHGGIWILPVIGNPLAFVASILVGTVVTGVVVTLLKRVGNVKQHVADVPGVPQTNQTVEA